MHESAAIGLARVRRVAGQPPAGENGDRGAMITGPGERHWADATSPVSGTGIRHDRGVRHSPRSGRPLALAAGLAALQAAWAVGCGFGVTSADLFVLRRTGQGRALTMLVNDGGTIRCNGGPARPIPDPLLLRARDLATKLDADAKAGLRLPPSANSVYSYSIRLPDGAISFADTDAVTHHELSGAELFAAQAAQGPCRSP
jgi:hypothetical protein